MPHYFTKKNMFICLLMVFTGSTIFAQEKESAAVERPPVGREYIFKALSFTSSSVSMRPLTKGEYDVRIKTDSVIVNLPYFGRTFTAKMNNVEGDGIKTVSTNFSYATSDKKKGKVLMTIKPTDSKEVQELFLTIFSDGTAVLQLTSANREFMSFNGYLLSK